MKILIVEDETEMSKTIETSLEQSGYRVETAVDFKTALDKIISFQYDCILLDIGLPDGSGLDLLNELKTLKKEDAVIIISAKDSVDDKIKGLELGADDYLAKPFHLAELNARIKSVIRRKNRQEDEFLTYKNLAVDSENRIVLIDSRELILNRKEFDLLYFFLTNPGRLIAKTSIAEYVWGDHAEDSDSLDFVYSQIKNLRKKLQQHGAEIEILSIYGAGYKLI
ncbi:MAG: response regulator transcription factor [Moheibacter sp.]